MHEKLFESFATSKSRSFHFKRGDNNLKPEKPSRAIAKEIMNIVVSLKSEAHDVNIKVRTDNQELNLKAIKVNN